MKLVDATELVSLGRRAVKRLGLVAGLGAKGFLIDLVYALDEEIGLYKVQVKKTGDPECRFRVSAVYDGDAEAQEPPLTL